MCGANYLGNKVGHLLSELGFDLETSDTLLIHIWFESNLVNFEFPEGLNTVLGSSQPPYYKTGLEFVLTKNVPFSKISVKI